MRKEGATISPEEGKVLYCTWNNTVHEGGFGLGYAYYRYGPEPLPVPYLLTEADFEETEPLGDDEVIVDGVRHKVGSKDYAYLKGYIVKLRYSNDDQIALILNHEEDPVAYGEAFASMQAWRDKAGFIARHYANG